MSSHLIWNIAPEIFSIGPLTVRWYGVMFAIGFLIGLQIMSWQAKKRGFEPTLFDSLFGYVVVGTIIGARLGHVLFYQPDVFLADPIRILKIWEGGLASHGASLGVIASIWFWKRKHFSGSVLTVLDFIAVPTCFAGAMIRIGNFFNSEILGRPSNVPWAIIFQRIDSTPRHPSMLYESAAYLISGAILFRLFQKESYLPSRFQKPGFLFGGLLTLIFTARFFIEFLKEVQVAAEASLPIDLGQILSIPFVIAGLVLIFRKPKPNPALKSSKLRS